MLLSFISHLLLPLPQGIPEDRRDQVRFLLDGEKTGIAVEVLENAPRVA